MISRCVSILTPFCCLFIETTSYILYVLSADDVSLILLSCIDCVCNF